MGDIILDLDGEDVAVFSDGVVHDNDVIKAVKKHMTWYDKLSSAKVAKATIIVQTLLYTKSYEDGDWKIRFE